MSDRTPAVPGSPAAGGGIPLELAPLLTPYGQHRRLLIQVAQLPPLARLSRGSRNEDGAWSLMPGELRGLELLLLDGAVPPSSLAIRLVRIDDNGDAAIVAQHDVPLAPVEPAVKAAGYGDRHGRTDRRVAVAQCSSEQRPAEPSAEAEAQVQAEREKPLSGRAKELEEEWRKKVRAERSAREAAEARAEEAEQGLTALAGELEAALARAATAEANAASHKGDTQRSAQDAEARLAKELKERIAAAQASWEKETEARITVAVKQAEKDSEVALEKAAKDAEARVADAVKQAVKEAEAAAETRLAEARAKWQEEVDRKLAAARQLGAEAQSAAQRLKAERTQAEARWQAESESRLAEQAKQLEQEWQEKLKAEQTAREAAEAKAEGSARKLAELSAEHEALSKRLVAAEAKEAERGSAAERDEKEIAARVAELVKERVAVSKVLWEQENEEGNAAAMKRAEEKGRAAAEAQFEKEHKRWEEESLQAFVEVEERWRNEEAERLAAARAEWEENARSEAAGGGQDLFAVSERDPLAVTEPELRPAAMRPKSRTWRRIQDAFLLAGGLIAVFVVYPTFKPLIVEEWMPKIEGLMADSGLLPPAEGQSPPGAAQPRMTVAARFANLRSGPSTSSPVVRTLERNTSVTVLERRGNWILIEVADDRTIQGWLHDSLLQVPDER